jgi:hypothetical protein
MSPLPALSCSAAARAMRAASSVRGVGDANHSRDLDGERSAGEQMYAAREACARRPKLSRNGTLEGAPLWNGPRLRPAFVAQVLGQVMMEPAKPALNAAPNAYTQATQIGPGAFFVADV